MTLDEELSGGRTTNKVNPYPLTVIIF